MHDFRRPYDGLPKLKVDMTDRLTRSFINKQWLDNLGIFHGPTSIDEYYDVLVAFKEQDANGTGIRMMRYRFCSLRTAEAIPLWKKHCWMRMVFLPRIPTMSFRQMRAAR